MIDETEMTSRLFSAVAGMADAWKAPATTGKAQKARWMYMDLLNEALEENYDQALLIDRCNAVQRRWAIERDALLEELETARRTLVFVPANVSAVYRRLAAHYEHGGAFVRLALKSDDTDEVVKADPHIAFYRAMADTIDRIAAEREEKQRARDAKESPKVDG